MSKPFKLAFPVVTLPPNLGGRRAIVMLSFSRPGEPNLLFSTCVDEVGNVHQAVPFNYSEVLEASKNPMTFVEAPEEKGPKLGGSGLVSPNGRPL